MSEDNVTLNTAGSQRGLFPSIRSKLIVSFCLLFVSVLVIIQWVDIMGVPLTPYGGRWGQERLEVFNSLSLIADLKKERLLRWIEERRDDGHVWADNELIADNVVLLRAAIRESAKGGREGAKLWELIREKKSYRTLVKTLDDVKNTYAVYDRIQIAEADTGTVIFSTDDAHLGTDVFPLSFFTGALKTGDSYISDIKIDPRTQQPALRVSHVIKGKESKVIAVLVMVVSVDDMITPMLHTGEGVGASGEALLVNKDVRILASLKHPLADGTKAKPLEYQIKAQPAVLAANGKEGVIESTDYRGEPVLAAYRSIRVVPDWNWGMVVKRDREELFAPSRQSTTYSFMIGLVGILAIVGLTITITRNLTRPIRSLSRTAAKVSKGDFDARAPVTTSDEVGALAATFNSMLQHIQNWQAQREAINDVFREALTCETEEDLGKKCLTVAEKLTGSKFGFIGELSSAGLMDDVAISNPGWDACKMAVEDARKYIMDMPIRGIDRSAIREGKSRIVKGDEMATHPDRVGTPEGHPEITAFLGVPLKHEGKTIGMIGLGNKDEGYEAADQEAVENLAGAIVEALRYKRAEQQIQKLNIELEQRIVELNAVNKELEAFSYSVSHDLRAPLRAIEGFSKILLEDFSDELDAEGQRLLDVIRSSTQNMAQLIDDLLAFSRLGRKTIGAASLDTGRLVKDVFEQVQQSAPGRTLQLKAELLPSAYGDRTMIREVVANLLSNAVKFTAPREAAVIEVGGRMEGNENIYYVKDNGVGFDMKYAGKLFSVFQRLHSAEEFEGTGIGLALVQRIIHRHGGRVWAEGKVDEGATFYFTLPRRE